MWYDCPRYPERLVYAGYPTPDPTLPANFAPPPYAEVNIEKKQFMLKGLH